MQKPLSTALKITLLSLSLPLLFVGNAWAKNCTEEEIETYISNKNYALIDCGAKAVPNLVKALKMGEEATSEFTASALEYIDTDGKTIVPALAEAFKNGNQYVRRSVSWALVTQAKREKAEAIALPILIEAIHAQDLETKLRSANAVGYFGSQAKAAVPVLIESLKHENAIIRWNAAGGLGKIGSDAEAAVPALIERLKDENATVRDFAASALGSIGKKAKAAIPGLVELLKDRNASVRSSAAYALVSVFNINVEYKPALPALMTALKGSAI